MFKINIDETIPHYKKLPQNVLFLNDTGCFLNYVVTIASSVISALFR